jgi:hypothetical protein
MYRTFREFVAQKDNQKQFRHKLLHRLGLEDDAIPLRAVDPMKLHDALRSMDLEDDAINDIDKWMKIAPDSRLKDLINQFGGSQSDLGSDQEQGDQIMGQPAELPAGEPRPKPQQMQQQQQQLYNQPPQV